jgi:hypothetical protein
MQGLIKTILGFLLIIIGFLTVLFFRKYSGDLIPYPIIWVLAGILCVIIGFLLIKSGLSSRDRKARQNLKAEINNFKLTADKIKVDLNNCKIRANNYTEQVEVVKNYKAQAFDALYDSSKNIANVNINQAVLIFETDKYGEKERYFSPTIYKDEVTLRFLLDRQKETYIYVDRDNRSRYYFDLEFLNE